MDVTGAETPTSATTDSALLYRNSKDTEICIKKLLSSTNSNFVPGHSSKMIITSASDYKCFLVLTQSSGMLISLRSLKYQFPPQTFGIVF